MSISDSEAGQTWLGQFRPEHVPVARRLLEHMLIVPTGDLRSWLSSEIEKEASAGMLALYGEREFNPQSRFFPKLKPGPVRRSIGKRGPVLVKPVRGSPYVGSEGIVAQLLSEMGRRRDVAAFLTPGPDRLRPMKSRGPISRLMIVTDLIGTGTRIGRMLDAMWRTPTIRSWHSHKKVELEIIVLAYAASEVGLRHVKAHRLGPRVSIRHTVPTIWDAEDDPEPFKQVCAYYEPMPSHDEASAFGYKDAGTLIAFGHGCPNTTPPLFWHNRRGWTALFPERSATLLEGLNKPSDVADFGRRLLAQDRPGLAAPDVLTRFEPQAREALILLSTIAHGVRGEVRLASRTGLPVGRVQSLLQTFASAGWIGMHGTITAAGLAELGSARKVLPADRTVPFDAVSIYFPRSLRG